MAKPPTRKPVHSLAGAAPLDLDHFVPFLLNSLTRRFNTRLELAFKRKGLTIHDWRLLATVVNTELNRPADIAEYIASDPSTLSRMIDRFVRAGLLKRNKPAGEARITELELTEFGSEFYSAAYEAITHERDRLLGALSAREREQFLRLLEKLCLTYEPAAYAPQRNNRKSAA